MKTLFNLPDVTFVCGDDQKISAHQVILAATSAMAHSSYGELRQLFETFTRVWGSGGQASLHLPTQDGRSRATLNIELGSPAVPRPGAPVVRGEGPGPSNSSQQPRQQRPRRRGPAARARDVARCTAWLQGKGEQAEPEHNISFMNTEICPDTETVPEDSTESSNEFVERSETETLDSDYSDVIPQLDGPAEECLTPDKKVIEDDSVKEEIMDLTHIPTADDTDGFNRYIKQGPHP